VAVLKQAQGAFDGFFCLGRLRDPGVESLRCRNAVEDSVPGDLGQHLGQVGFAGTEIARYPDADFRRALAEGVGIMFQKLIDIAFQDRSHHEAADFRGQLFFVQNLPDLDDGFDFFSESGFKDVADFHECSPL